MNLTRADVRGIGHLLAIALLWAPWIQTMADAWILVGYGLALALLWPHIPYLNTLHKGWPDWGIISYPLAVGLALSLTTLMPAIDHLTEMGDSEHLLIARILTLPMAVADPIHGWIGRRDSGRKAHGKSRRGLFASVPALLALLFLLVGEDWFSTGQPVHPSEYLFFLLSFSPLLLGAWTETWWRWGSDNVPVVLATSAGTILLLLLT